MSGIYIHIPFCKQACSYCDFYFVTQTKLRDSFVDSLIKEIEEYHDTPYAEEPVKSIYFGGGTPSLLEPNHLDEIFSALEAAFDLHSEETTLEMNPDDVSVDYLESLREIGIDRASMGIQSFQPDLLEFMNRAHDRDEALKCMKQLKEAGFKIYTVDLIYGNPGQSLDKLEKDLDLLLQFDPPHISAYSLTIEPKTRLGKQVELGRLDPPDNDMVADHFDLIADKFSDNQIYQYEVSNFSKKGFEAIHNSSYWKHENYLGFGPAAHSFWWNRKGAYRWENKERIKSYIDNSTELKKESERLTKRQLAEERLMLGLRTKWGVPLDELESRYDYLLNERQRDYLHKRDDEGKVFYDGEKVKLTRKGLKIADAVILDLITLKD